jgi:hypothetical protein
VEVDVTVGVLVFVGVGVNKGLDHSPSIT